MDAVTGLNYSAASFRRRATAEQPPHGGALGDHALNPDLEDLILNARLRDAAILVPVVDHGSEATVILTKRTDHLSTHSGQIAFPGGRIDAEDASPEDAALRETEEEIGLDRSFIEVVGRMPDYVSGSGFRIAPVLSVVRPDFMLTLNRDEVDDAFEVPLAFLMDPANHSQESLVWQGRERHFYTMPYEQRYIWGITAGIIRTLYERLYA